jgi:hypothetical protein
MLKYFHHKPGTETNFTKLPKEETVEIYADENKALKVRQLTEFDVTLKQIESVADQCESAGTGGDKLADCMASNLVDHINAQVSSKSTLKKMYKNIASRMRNYTCADESMESSPTLYQLGYREEDGKELIANVLFDTPVAKIWYVENFATESECKTLMDHGAPRLKRATVAAEDGTSVVSEHRKAQQAVYQFDRDNLMDDPLG